ncbi:cytochrome P450 [Apiospora rasikravindrae]|uniref:Cytochrome P450 n=1 Tax=Apiospora rasikravindrae TaxID=990691 RepID=A0ABR1RZC0_9PEZI
MHIEKLIEEKEQQPEPKVEQSVGGRPTLFRYMVHESGLPDEDLTVDRLTKEAQILLGAGSVSTGRTLHFITFYLLSNPHMRARLEEELKGELKDPGERPTWSQLEKLPYLQALIKEGLRYAFRDPTQHLTNCNVMTDNNMQTQLRYHAPIAPRLARRSAVLPEQDRRASLESASRGE